MTNKDSDLETLQRAVVGDPRNAELRYLFAAELAQEHDYERAVLEFSAAVALNPQLHAARLQLGLLHLTLAQPHHAVTVLAPLEDLDDSSEFKYFKRGLEALIRDEFQACATHLQHGIELNSLNPPLNADMNLIVAKVQELLETQAAEGRNRSAGGVRTDFSLYGVAKQ
jgi:tetratricopeptide (TPR) repeat protein